MSTVDKKIAKAKQSVGVAIKNLKEVNSFISGFITNNEESLLQSENSIIELKNKQEQLKAENKIAATDIKNNEKTIEALEKHL